MTMESHIAKPELYRWADGELPSARQQQVERHLTECRLCQREAHSIRQVQQLLRSPGPVLEPSPQFETAFWHRVAARTQPQRLMQWWNVHAWLPGVRLSHALAGMVIALVIGGLGGAVSVVSADDEKTFPRSLSGFDERMGVPTTSVTANYLKVLGEDEE